jgi:hypothetical protein
MFILGYSRSFDGDMSMNEGENDVFLMYLPSDGSQKRTLTLGGEGEDFAFDFLIQRDGTVYVVGQSYSENISQQKNMGQSDILMARWR